MMLNPIHPQRETAGAEIGRAFRAILDWMGRTRTKTTTIEIRIAGRELIRVEIDRGKT
tara:strand:+ start:824 stop:997 length:174 start_codon:yes stop_codon:yes gene_type:complete